MELDNIIQDIDEFLDEYFNKPNKNNNYEDEAISKLCDIADNLEKIKKVLTNNN